VSRVIKAAELEALDRLQSEREVLEEYAPGRADEPKFEKVPPSVVAARILAEAREQAEKKLEEGYAEGMRRGQEAGEAAYAEAVAQSAAALRSAAEEIRAARQQFLDSLEEQLVMLAQAMVRRILHREARTDPELVRTTVRAALEHLVEREQFVIRLNPDDLRALREKDVKLLDEFDGVNDLEVVPDDAVGPGGCIVETESVEVDAQLETQLQQLVDAMMPDS
jgi:flagellar assembly protein FliH